MPEASQRQSSDDVSLVAGLANSSPGWFVYLALSPSTIETPPPLPRTPRSTKHDFEKIEASQSHRSPVPSAEFKSAQNPLINHLVGERTAAPSIMDASLASYHARLATFQGAATKTRRTSSRSKKAPPKARAGWPLQSPSAEDLALAGFVWKPTSASPDNVQCWACNCQLDGWEEADVPAYEHATHSPSCGFAIVTTIRLRHGDPGRTEEDPIGEAMVAARKETFADLWPLDTAAGYPSVDQLAAAGWFYDPTAEMPDGVTCPYCHLSLDAWDQGDDPMEEHRRRASDCLFFALAEMYHPTKPEPKKTKRATKAKRASTRTSTSSNATVASTTATKTTKKTKRASTRTSTASSITAATKKSTRGKKRTSEAVDDTQYSETVQESSKRIRYSSISSLPDDLPVGTPKKMPSDVDTEPFIMSSLPRSLPVGTPKRTPPHLKDPEDYEEAIAWKPTDTETLFANQQDVRGFVNDIFIDSGLDELTATANSSKDIQAAVLAGLTDAEKAMVIEQWVLFNAKRGEEKLRMACEQQIGAFEAEGKRALSMMESIPTY